MKYSIIYKTADENNNWVRLRVTINDIEVNTSDVKLMGSRQRKFLN